MPRVVHCKREPYDVYVGRGRGSIWGNPFRVGRDGTREQVIIAYERWLLRQPDLLARLPELRGKTLGCWCAPQPCHADVLLRLANAAGDRMAPCRGIYAGIGSRRTPTDVLDLMTQLATQLAQNGWVLRTGLATGADQAFHRGATKAGTPMAVEVYLPWGGFEEHALCHGPEEVVFAEPSAEAHTMAARLHPSWPALGRGPRALHARNCHQILGGSLDRPARFVVCWTPDGSLDGSGSKAGGTGQALRVAREHGVTVFNLARAEHHDRVQASLAGVPAAEGSAG